MLEYNECVDCPGSSSEIESFGVKTSNSNVFQYNYFTFWIEEARQIVKTCTFIKCIV